MKTGEQAKNKLLRARIQLLWKRPFFGFLALGLELLEFPKTKGLATDGKHLLYNPEYVCLQNENVLETLIAHEILHCILRHLWRLGSRELNKWNYATDYAVNLILKREKFVLWEGALYEDCFAGMEAERIYDLLPDDLPSQDQDDSHDKWPGTSRSKTKNEEGNEEQDGGNPSADPKKQDGASSGGEQSETMEKEWTERAVRAATSARMQGKLPGSIAEFIQDLLEPKLNWRVILRDMITTCAKNDFRLFPPSKKHLWRGMYLPTVQGETLEIAVGVDSSGSIEKEEFQEFMAEVKGIGDQFEDYSIHLFICDAKIQSSVVLTPFGEWPEEFPKHNGGTDFKPVFDGIEEEGLHITALVYLTDGAGDYPEYPPEYPVIWALNKDHDVPFGEKIVMEVEK